MHNKLKAREHIDHLAHMIHDFSGAIGESMSEEMNEDYIQAFRETAKHFDDLEMYVIQLREFLEKEARSLSKERKEHTIEIEGW